MDGIYLVDKPSGPTSHDIVQRARRVLGVRRVGHAGTLDPLATGLLVLGVGRATRLLRFVEGQPKRYLVHALIGVRTSTGDLEGETLEVGAPEVDPDRVAAVAVRFIPGYVQVPPVYSAIRVGGERAYEAARRGERIALAGREVAIVAIEVVGVQERDGHQVLELAIACGPGTYVRSLVEDLARELGTVATVAGLRRVAIGELEVAEALRVEDLGNALPVELAHALAPLAKVRLDADTAARFAGGSAVPAEGPEEGWVLVGAGGGWIGVGERRTGLLRPRVVVWPEEARA